MTFKHYAVSVCHYLDMMKKYLCTVGMLCFLALYNLTGDHACCFII